MSSGYPSSRDWSSVDLGPGCVFFYGTLMDPEVLQTILSLPELPVMERGHINGFSMKM